MIVFAVGVNDSSRMNGENRVPLTNYIRNMEELIDQTKGQFTNKIFCVGLAPIDQSKSVPFILERTVSFFTADQRQYDSALEEVCDRKGVGYVSLRNMKLEDDLSEDGVHPLSPGHARIANRVLENITRQA